MHGIAVKMLTCWTTVLENVTVSLLSTSKSDGKILIVVLYVDDLIFIGSDVFFITDFIEVMKSEFEITDLGL